MKSGEQLVAPQHELVPGMQKSPANVLQQKPLLQRPRQHSSLEAHAPPTGFLPRSVQLGHGLQKVPPQSVLNSSRFISPSVQVGWVHRPLRHTPRFSVETPPSASTPQVAAQSCEVVELEDVGHLADSPLHEVPHHAHLTLHRSSLMRAALVSCLVVVSGCASTRPCLGAHAQLDVGAFRSRRRRGSSARGATSACP